MLQNCVKMLQNCVKMSQIKKAVIKQPMQSLQ